MKRILLAVTMTAIFHQAVFAFSPGEIFSRQTGSSVYVIINGLIAGDGMEQLLKKHRHVSLFHGWPMEKFTPFSPVLFPLDPGSPLLDWLARNPCISRQSLFLSGPGDLNEVLHHLQRLILITEENKQSGSRKLFFRFYDPSVLDTAILIAEKEQLPNFFGPINQYYTFNPAEGVYRIFSFENQELYVTVVRSKEEQPCPPPAATAAKTALMKNNPQLRTFDQAILRMVPFTAICSCCPLPDAFLESVPIRFSSAQYEQFSLAQIKKFKYALFYQLQRIPAAQKIKPRDLETYIGYGTDRARHHGLTTEAQFFTYIHAMLIFGFRFDEEKEWARKLMTGNSLTAQEKTQGLNDAISLSRVPGGFKGFPENKYRTPRPLIPQITPSTPSPAPKK